MNGEALLEKAEGVATELQDYLKSDKWEKVKETESFKIHCMKSKYFSGHLYKGEAEYNTSARTVFDYVEPLPEGKRAEWDKNMKKIEVLKKIDTNLRINRACTDSACMGVISARDFVDLILTKETDTYLSTNAISLDQTEYPYPEEKKFVRGKNYPCGIVVIKYSNNPDKCKLVSLIQPDIKGNVPKALTDAAIPGSMTEFFSSLSKALKADNKLIS